MKNEYPHNFKCIYLGLAPNPTYFFASVLFIYFCFGDFRFAPIVLTQKTKQKDLTLRIIATPFKAWS